MNQNELVDMIVREVKRVLAERGVTVQSGTEKVSVSVPPSFAEQRPSAEVSGVTIPAAGASSVGTSDLAGKQVITQKDLKAFQGQVINVTKNAVITPLAHDYARDKNITITRLKETPASHSSAHVSDEYVSVALTVAPDFKGDASVLKKILSSKNLGVKEFSGGSYEANIKKVADAVVSGAAHFGVCLENTGMEAPIHANRNSLIRAVHCRETYDARAARVDISANVIVLDSASNPEAIISGFTGL